MSVKKFRISVVNTWDILYWTGFRLLECITDDGIKNQDVKHKSIVCPTVNLQPILHRSASIFVKDSLERWRV